jgi:hypothetical protein
LLKLDEELATWDHPKAKIWHENLKPLTDKILTSWKTFCLNKPILTEREFIPIPLLQWFLHSIGQERPEIKILKISSLKRQIFLSEQYKNTCLSRTGRIGFLFAKSGNCRSDAKSFTPKEFVVWLNNFYEKRSLENIEKIPVVSDLSDYQTVHLVGLSFSKAWCMKGIAKSLPANHPLKQKFEKQPMYF